MSLDHHLQTLGARALTALLQRRPDVLVEPAPRTLDELALRLGGTTSLVRELVQLTSDDVAVVRAVALLGSVSVAVVAQRLHSPEAVVRAVVDRLGERGLVWESDGTLELPERLARQFNEALQGFRPLSVLAKEAPVGGLRDALAGLGGTPAGTSKTALTEQLAARLADSATVVRSVMALSPPAQRHLDQLLRLAGQIRFGTIGGPETELIEAGLLIGGRFRNGELPREVAVALMMHEPDPLTGHPDLPPATSATDDGRAGAEAALLALTSLLDEAAVAPLAELRKGGIGTRERKRLATRLGVADPALWIDVAHAIGQLVPTLAGYAPAAAYARWRDEPLAARWAQAALAWFALELAPTSRETDDGEVSPPLAMGSMAGVVRRALLRAAAGGRSLRAAAEQLDWFSPMHHYDDEGRARKVAAAEHEGALLGVLTGDRLTELGELLVEAAAGPAAAAELAARAADLLPETRGLLVLQSDLTAVVSGQASSKAAELLAASAVPEGKGVAATWRFTPASVRAALDAGWTADELRTQLAAVSGRELPQPLDYLLTDVARRHGSVRVRGSRSCLVGSEPEIAEILHTRSLAKLHLTQLAPTVLSSSVEIKEVLAKLRAAGFAPVQESAAGAVVVARKVAPPEPAGAERPRRATLDAAELATRLSSPTHVPPPPSKTFLRLGAMTAQLDFAELALLADALDNHRAVHIRYRNKDGNLSERDIAPKELWDRWLYSWCYLRSGDREFAVPGIESVAPAG
ncbi:helicase-associated domain-containing protein [Pseudonocardia sp. GCM10023141]|uniref:helicase-associated domain-containing protein n=1 Tax=Pseudonocardia sp. GCM10023141 TaxID=3252653 RepID=UPI00361AC48F